MQHTALAIIAALVIVLFIVSGCVSSFKAIETSQAAAVFNTALKVAAKVLANDGTQKLATAAAEAVVLSQIADPGAQAVACKVLEAAVPKVATGLSTVLTHCTTRKAATIDKYDQYTESEAFGQLVLECTQEYDRNAAK